MTAGFELLDYIVFTAYAALILGVGLWVSRDKKGHQKRRARTENTFFMPVSDGIKQCHYDPPGKN